MYKIPFSHSLEHLDQLPQMLHVGHWCAGGCGALVGHLGVAGADVPGEATDLVERGRLEGMVQGGHLEVARLDGVWGCEGGTSMECGGVEATCRGEVVWGGGVRCAGGLGGRWGWHGRRYTATASRRAQLRALVHSRPVHDAPRQWRL
eukprot:scaffold9050_cov80-Isochrysis_galbana.AAC.1